MNIAFDKNLQIEVKASEIAKQTGEMDDAFRFECLCCGEPVKLCAADSHYRMPHFRHCHGNNDIDCEKYLGGLGDVGADVQLRRANAMNLHYYFNKDDSRFELGLSFSEDELTKATQEKRRMDISTSRAANGRPLFSCYVDRAEFFPGEVRYFPIKAYSREYHLLFSSAGNKKTHIEFAESLNREKPFTVFRNTAQNIHLRILESRTVYTETEYLIITEKKSVVDRLVKVRRNVAVVEEPFEYVTMNTHFWSVLIKI